MKRGWLAGLLAAAALSFAAPARCQVNVAGLSLGSLPGLSGGIPITGGAMPTLGVNMFQPSMWTAPQRYRDLKVAGRPASAGSQVPPGSRMVRLNLEGEDLPMAIDTETSTADIHFAADEQYARELYRAVLSKRVRVIADDFTTARIRRAVDNKAPITIEGYVFDRMSPYLVVRSVEAAR